MRVGQRPAHERQGLIEAVCKLRRDDVLAQRVVGAVHAFGELEDEVARVDMFGDVDEVFDVGCHG